MTKKDILDLESRRKIYNYVLAHPGMHLRELSRKLSLSYSTLNYHLCFLEKQGFITSKIHGVYRRYYAKYKVSEGNKKIVGILREQTPSRIIIFLLANVCGTRSEISIDLEKVPQTVDFHLKKLLEMDMIEPACVCDGGVYLPRNQIIVERIPVGNEILFKLKNARIIYDSLIMYQNSVTDIPNLDIILDWFNFCFSCDIPKRISSSKIFEGKIIDMLYDIFPHPYHV